jgi:arsenite methyltransferase
MTTLSTKPDYGVDAPGVMRNLFMFGSLCVLLAMFTPRVWHLGKLQFQLHYALAWTGGFLLLEGCLFLLYVKVGKFRHRDKLLAIVNLRGSERVLDVGCGRGLLLAGAARRLSNGTATGIDIWSNVDMGGNSEEATRHNLELEGIARKCTLVSAGAQAMPFADGSFDVIVSNLCLHNIYDKPTRAKAVEQIARVLRPGGLAVLSDYKRTTEYAGVLRRLGWTVEERWGNVLTTFPPLRIVVARKPGGEEEG